MLTPNLCNFYYRRLSFEDYTKWYAEEVGVTLTDEDIQNIAALRSRGLIESPIDKLKIARAEIDESPKEVFKAASIEVEEIPNTEDFPSDLSYDSMTLKELREVCKSRSLPFSGTKAEISLRLKRDDEGIIESTVESEAPVNTAAEEGLDAPVKEAAATEVVINDDSERQEPIAETNE